VSSRQTRGRWGSSWVIRPGINLQHVLHPPAELSIPLGRNAPAFLQPRLETVCFKAWRTVSCETASTTSKLDQPLRQHPQRPALATLG
jgi:hypothetical protein